MNVHYCSSTSGLPSRSAVGLPVVRLSGELGSGCIGGSVPRRRGTRALEPGVDGAGSSMDIETMAALLRSKLVDFVVRMGESWCWRRGARSGECEWFGDW
jgi:hypothetical protein